MKPPKPCPLQRWSGLKWSCAPCLSLHPTVRYVNWGKKRKQPRDGIPIKVWLKTELRPCIQTDFQKAYWRRYRCQTPELPTSQN